MLLIGLAGVFACLGFVATFVTFSISAIGKMLATVVMAVGTVLGTTVVTVAASYGATDATAASIGIMVGATTIIAGNASIRKRIRKVKFHSNT
jgi:hypothetical protein